MGKTTTSSFRRGESLPNRLQILKNYYQGQEHIWDIGCDHGLLGLSFLKEERVHEIHLVDPSKPVIDTLRNNLKDSYITKENLFIHHNKGQDLTLNSSSNCIFIAGMGGKEIGEIILHLLPQLKKGDLIILSPHRKILELRRLLNTLPVLLIDEVVIEEDQQFYQIIGVTPGEGPKKVSLYGEKIWGSPVGEKYLDQQIKTYLTHKDGSSKDYLEYLNGLRP